jgi:phosphoketolase
MDRGTVPAELSVFGPARATAAGAPLSAEELWQIDAFCIDRVRLAIDVIDRVPRLQVAGAHARETVGNRQMECRHYAHEHRIDRPGLAEWGWPF